jgi:ADYC domain
MILLAAGIACGAKHDHDKGGGGGSGVTTVGSGSGSATTHRSTCGLEMPDVDGCTGPHCDGGGNSPHTNTFPINGLDSDQCNADYMVLVGGSLHGGGCGDGADLALDSTGHHIVGMRAGTTACQGSALEHAKFTVGGPTDTAELEIAKVKTSNIDGSDYEQYKIEYKHQSVCKYAVSMDVDTHIGSGGHTPVACDWPNGSAGDGSDDDLFVVAMGGPIFSSIDASVVSEPNNNPNFFNLACVGDALAKTMFWSLDDTVSNTVAALRMITARYFDAQAFTKRGMFIDFGSDGSAKGLPIEAEWNYAGSAVCIHQPRLLTYADENNIKPDQMPLCVQPPACLATPCNTDKKYLTGLRGNTGGSAIPDCVGSAGSDILYVSYGGSDSGSGNTMLTRRSR